MFHYGNYGENQTSTSQLVQIGTSLIWKLLQEHNIPF